MAGQYYCYLASVASHSCAFGNYPRHGRIGCTVLKTHFVNLRIIFRHTIIYRATYGFEPCMHLMFKILSVGQIKAEESKLLSSSIMFYSTRVRRNGSSIVLVAHGSRNNFFIFQFDALIIDN